MTDDTKGGSGTAADRRVKRYVLYGRGALLWESHIGDICRFDDYAVLEAERDALRATLAERDAEYKGACESASAWCAEAAQLRAQLAAAISRCKDYECELESHEAEAQWGR